MNAAVFPEPTGNAAGKWQSTTMHNTNVFIVFYYLAKQH